MTLHRTPVHHQVLGMVRDGNVKWLPAAPAGLQPSRSAGFAHASGCRFELSHLVAPYELLGHELIEKRGERVLLTAAGCQRLSEWDATRAVHR